MVIEQGSHLVPHEVRKAPEPLNPLGEWIERVREPRGLNKRQIFDLFGLKHHTMAGIPATNISLYTIERFLQGAERLDCSPEEIGALADAVTTVIQETLEAKGKLYERIPPYIPRMAAKELECVAYSDTQFARILDPEGTDDRKLHNLARRIRKARMSINLPTVFTEDQAKEIKNTLDQAKEKDTLRRRSEMQVGKNHFAKQIVAEVGIDPRLIKGYWKSRENNIPNPEEFGILLQNADLAEEKQEQLIQLWLDEFRNRLPIQASTLANEFGVSRQMMRLNRLRVNSDGKLSNWEIIEKIRERYRIKPRQRKAHAIAHKNSTNFS